MIGNEQLYTVNCVLLIEKGKGGIEEGGEKEGKLRAQFKFLYHELIIFIYSKSSRSFFIFFFPFILRFRIDLDNLAGCRRRSSTIAVRVYTHVPVHVPYIPALIGIIGYLRYRSWLHWLMKISTSVPFIEPARNPGKANAHCRVRFITKRVTIRYY